MKTFFTFLVLFFFIVSGTAVSDGPGNISATKHNLSAMGGQVIRAQDASVTGICVFCHTPHMALANTPLWNHSLSTKSSYTVYSSPTLLSVPLNPPDGDSRLCLSCHDGDQPLGSLINYGGGATTIAMTQQLPLPGPGSTNFGSDLSGHHPVSIEITPRLKECKDLHPEKGCPSLNVDWTLQSNIDNSYLKRTANVFNYSTDCSGYGSSTLSTGKGVQCSSCHDAHSGNWMFLRVGGAPPPDPWGGRDYNDALCTACHTACLL